MTTYVALSTPLSTPLAVRNHVRTDVPAGVLADPPADPPAMEVTLRVDGAEPLSAGLVAELHRTCDRAEDADLPVRVLLRLSGTPRGDTTGSLTITLVNSWERALRRLERLEALTVALVDGDIGGTAVEALLVTDHRVAARHLRVTLPRASGQAWPGMSLYRLSRQVGETAARRALRGRPIWSEEAQRLGLVDELVDSTPATEEGWSSRLPVPAPDTALRRSLVLNASSLSFEDALGVHLAACDRTLRGAARTEEPA
ncbi:enoyl-CoA-hydratase DpgB [Streptomyces sp. V4-01]|uniref:Enoyl-CoA-hydratase DpgB n=1 Tax=Actinacidiphila polyblastidii TaxID=3110430 RepID=A0ABU7PIG2_9ACTN|nr:enoyl-CoA-hydratase DpgB [Streptomyces sp. V4-01]